ncbi:hypothetical protein EV668_0381 [Enterovirga rhinocerotis]|uniref:Uncharacterized protein n=1 Tax=Enterovirga rhinocerotis TaxID=1339210 RepID=A0A4R7C8T6_9HYPH|nr:hypothetical protein EV668_0381 [Enterovirga rhinocerotis]
MRRVRIDHMPNPPPPGEGERRLTIHAGDLHSHAEAAWATASLAEASPWH